MRIVVLDLPTFAFVVGTRAALAAGIGLLASRFVPDRRKIAVGTALVALGAATTVPAVVAVMRGMRRRSRGELRAGVYRDERLIGTTRFPRKGDDDLM